MDKYKVLNILEKIQKGQHVKKEEQKYWESINQLDLSYTSVSDISVIGSLTNLTSLDLSHTAVDDISVIGSLANLTSLDLSHTAVSDIRAIGGLTNLIYLDVKSTSVRDISALGRLTNLTYLDLSSTFVSDISALRSLTNLTELYLRSTSVNDIRVLGSLTNLTKLSLRSTSVGDISALESLTNLTRLSLNSTLVRDISALGSLANLTELYLSSTSVNDISALRNLTNLTNLDLGLTLVSDIRALGSLTNLTGLSLRSTSVRDIRTLGSLTNLTGLSLSSTPIRDISALGSLTNLTGLYLSSTLIRDISALGSLTNLTGLYLSLAPVNDISVLGSLTNLTELDLSSTLVKDISALGSLINLTELSLSSTSVRDISTLANLKKIKALDLANLELEIIPEELLYMGVDFCQMDNFFARHRGINIYKVKLLDGTPLEIFNQPIDEIRVYYRSRSQQKEQLMNESKVVFLGHGGIGKTYTILRILNGGKLPEEDTKRTPGVKIYPYKPYDKDKFQINFWDFGGQEIMHALHRCFLTDQTCYVVMVDTRQKDTTEQALYWLNNINSFAHDCPVIIAVNKWDDNLNIGIDQNTLLKQFTNIKTFKYFCATKQEDTGFQELLAEINHVVAEMEIRTRKYPESWVKIRDAIRAKSKPYISSTEFQEMCRDYRETEDNVLKAILTLFNNMGVCFSYHTDEKTNSILEDYYVLDPKWITNASYIIVTNASGRAENGVIFKQTITDILEKSKESVEEIAYTDEHTRYILEIMRKYRLSYKIDDKKEFIPILCSKDSPKDSLKNTLVGAYEQQLSYKVKYAFLPDSVIHQLMIHYNKLLISEALWIKGFTMKEVINGNSLMAVVTMGYGDNTLHIEVYRHGSYPCKDMFFDIRKEISEINSRLNLEIEKEYISKFGKDFSVEELLIYRANGIPGLPYIYNEKPDYILIDELLGEIVPKEQVDQTEKRPTTMEEIVQYHTHIEHIHIKNVTVNHNQGISEDILKTILKKQRKLHKQDLEMFASILAENATGEAQKLGQDMKDAKTKKSMVEILSDRLQDGANLATIVQGIDPAISLIKAGVEKAPGLMNAIGGLIGKIPTLPL